MYSVSPPTPETHRPFLTWQSIIDWSQQHYRCRTFTKDEPIPVRPGLLYRVQCGLVRLVSVSEISASKLLKQQEEEGLFDDDDREEAFLGFAGAGHPFEIITQTPFSLEAYAHVDQTTVIWMYWSDLETWPHFRREVLDAFRYQHQRKLLLLSALGQRRTIDRLLGFLSLLIEEYGEPCDQGYRLPWPLTHAQIGSAIGSTRVTVTRLMGKLRHRGLIQIQGDNLICFTSNQLQR
jgi:CRP-like cAMP-binding protein